MHIVQSHTILHFFLNFWNTVVEKKTHGLRSEVGNTEARWGICVPRHCPLLETAHLFSRHCLQMSHNSTFAQIQISVTRTRNNSSQCELTRSSFHGYDGWDNVNSSRLIIDRLLFDRCLIKKDATLHLSPQTRPDDLSHVTRAAAEHCISAPCNWQHYHRETSEPLCVKSMFD